MKSLKQNWKLLLAAALLIAAAMVYGFGYRPAQALFEQEKGSLLGSISVWETQITSTQAKIEASKAMVEEYRPYEDIQDDLEAATQALDDSRAKLYAKFPSILREEDQILYVLYLEELFGTEINFSFNPEEERVRLSDGAILGDVPLTVNYETSYQGFKDMVTYLATDSRITSIKNSVLAYDKEEDRLLGNLTLLCYVLQPDAYDPNEYVEPDITPPEETGKAVIFH